MIALLVVTLVVGFGGHNVASADGPKPPKAGKELKLPKDFKLAAGQHYRSTVVNTPDGDVTIEISDIVDDPTPDGDVTIEPNDIVDDPAPTGATADTLVTAATVYYRSCWVSATGVGWRIKLTSTFQWDYSTLWQQTPRISPSTVLPWHFTDLKAWNSYWTRTVRFADGQGVLHGGVGNIGVAVTYNLIIQEDAWGNCTPKAWRS